VGNEGAKGAARRALPPGPPPPQNRILAMPKIAAALWRMRESGPPPPRASPEAAAPVEAEAAAKPEDGPPAPPVAVKEPTPPPPPPPPVSVKAPTPPPRSPTPAAAPPLPPLSPPRADPPPFAAPASLRWFGGGDAPAAGPGPAEEGARAAVCPATGARRHAACLAPADAAAAAAGAWAETPEAGAGAAALAALAAAGARSAGFTRDGVVPLTFLLVRPAAVVDPASCRGPTPAYGASARAALARVLRAARHVAADAFGAAPDSRAARAPRGPLVDTLPLLLAGVAAGPARDPDWSDAHVAVLFAGAAVAAVAVLRVRGPAAEIPALAVRPELRGCGVGGYMLTLVEGALLKAGASLALAPGVPAAARALAPPGSLGPPPPPPPDGCPEPAWWLARHGYGLASAADLAAVAALPVLAWQGAATLAKPLSLATRTTAPPPATLTLAHGVPAVAATRARLLAPHRPGAGGEGRRVRARMASVGLEMDEGW